MEALAMVWLGGVVVGVVLGMAAMFFLGTLF
jgi:hypothetical protein